MAASIRIKHNFSKQHLRSSYLLACEAKGIEEKAERPRKDDNLWASHRAYVTGAIISAVAGLEASINEFFLEACDRSKRSLNGLDGDVVSLIADMWLEIERKPILSKYQICLSLARKDKFMKSRQPYKDAESLVKLRNSLVHYKPEWDEEAKVHDNLQKRLSGKFDWNPLASPGHIWFPHKCLGSGCALWSFSTAQNLIADFCQRLGIPNRCIEQP